MDKTLFKREIITKRGKSSRYLQIFFSRATRDASTYIYSNTFYVMKILKTLIPGPIPMPRERFEVQHRNISEYIMFKNLFYISSNADRCPRDCLKRYIEPLWLTYNTPTTHNHGLLKIKPPTTSSFILMVAWTRPKNTVCLG